MNKKKVQSTIDKWRDIQGNYKEKIHKERGTMSDWKQGFWEGKVDEIELCIKDLRNLLKGESE